MRAKQRHDRVALGKVQLLDALGHGDLPGEHRVTLPSCASKTELVAALRTRLLLARLESSPLAAAGAPAGAREPVQPPLHTAGRVHER